MTAIAKPLALLALLATVGPPVLYMFDGISANDSASAESQAAADESASDESNDSATAGDEAADSDGTAGRAGLMPESRMKTIMLVGAVLWFCTAPAWLKEND